MKKQFPFILTLFIALFFSGTYPTFAAEGEFQAFDTTAHRKVVDANGVIDAEWSLCLNINMDSPGNTAGGTGAYSKIENPTEEQYLSAVRDLKDGNASLDPNFQKAKRLLYFIAKNPQRISGNYGVFQNELYALNGVKSSLSTTYTLPAHQALDAEVKAALVDPSKDAQIESELVVSLYMRAEHRGEQNLITARVVETPPAPNTPEDPGEVTPPAPNTPEDPGEVTPPAPNTPEDPGEVTPPAPNTPEDPGEVTPPAPNTPKEPGEPPTPPTNHPRLPLTGNAVIGLGMAMVLLLGAGSLLRAKNAL